MRLVILCFFLLCLGSGVYAQGLVPPIGEWREHLPYNSAIDVVAGAGQVYCATPYSLFRVDPQSREIERLSRMTGLSETGVSSLSYDEINDKLIIAYTNSNVDIVHENRIINIPDIKRENISGDKSIYHIFSQDNLYYLATGLGVILVDGNKNEIRDTWYIGDNGSPLRVNDFVSDGTFFYAATPQGLKTTPAASGNPSDFTNWQLESGAGGLPEGECRNLVTAASRVFVLKNDSVYAGIAGSWLPFYSDGWPILAMNASDGKIILSERLATGEARIQVLDPGGPVLTTLQQPGLISFPQKAIRFGDAFWVADRFGSLSQFADAGSYESYEPNSPEDIASGEMSSYDDVVLVTAGSVNDSWNYQFNGSGIFRFEKGQWTNINRFAYSALDSMLDFITVADDPLDHTVWAGSYGGGLLHIADGPAFEIYKQNSSLQQAIGDPGSYRVSGLAFDRDHNLWVSNYGAPQPLHLRKPDGTWIPFSIPLTLTENALAQVLVDDYNLKWIVSPKGNGLICYDSGNETDNTTDDRWKLYRFGAGNGNLPSNNVYCVAKDKDGFIWVGTSDGMVVIQCPQLVFSVEGCPAYWPVISQGNFAGYLFKGEEVRSIAVDGANRKWVATRNGVWLVSPEGDQIIYRFSEDDSPLLSNDVRRITVNNKTGEVFFATARGICSFRSTATGGGPRNSGVLVFPNPVPPGFGGTIAIRGLVDNAIVKITELDGRLVYQARALGGQAIWNGRDYRGHKISSGVYLVLVSDESHREKTVSKIIFISN